MTSYPFSTRRPDTLLADLRAMIPRRGALSADEKCRGVQWLTAGALDAAGNPPRWRLAIPRRHGAIPCRRGTIRACGSTSRRGTVSRARLLT